MSPTLSVKSRRRWIYIKHPIHMLSGSPWGPRNYKIVVCILVYEASTTHKDRNKKLYPTLLRESGKALTPGEHSNYKNLFLWLDSKPTRLLYKHLEVWIPEMGSIRYYPGLRCAALVGLKSLSYLFLQVLVISSTQLLQANRYSLDRMDLFGVI
jgi:hypothetical protein